MVAVKKIASPLVRTVKVKLLKGVVLGPGEDGGPGDIYEVPKHLATELVHNRQAEYTDEGDPLQHDETPKGEPRGVPGDEYSTTTIETPTSRDPKPKKRG